ncbi:PEP-CTERM motif protein [Symmachiella macrocystis]|uniref:PEP-CTERM motif protein n=1 Tax=Symmachiella macrocystis TaxID=2527985 RepID=A0A5C6BQL4_9PLAN|nr:PEP-CTERM sorting domain-containing protein [Symmachiella macrocystis]TWU14530.1 PEP-CTERM motif protein [Symmachiella macrocystis]
MKQKTRLRIFSCFAVPILLFALDTTTQAGPILGFGRLSANSVGDSLIGETQLTVELSDVGSSQVAFIFRNAGPDASSIADVYFDDDGNLASIASLIDADDGVGGDLGVDFSPGANPPNIPARNNISPSFDVTVGLLADSDAPAQPNGVNPGEQLTVIMNLMSGVTFADTVAAIDLAGAAGGLRIGIHVQGFASGGSETFVNIPPDLPPPPPAPGVVPEPSSMLLMAMGMFGLAGYGWRKRKLQAT